MSDVRVRIRGIYTTALTGLLLEKGYLIVEPSEVIRARFGLPESPGPWDVAIADRRDRQGIVIEGVKEAVGEVVGALRDALPYALFRELSPRTRAGPFAKLQDLKAAFIAKFPSPAKEALDAIRSRYVLTIPGHHHLKAIDAARVDAAEGEALKDPKRAPELAKSLKEELIWRFFLPGKPVVVKHLKAGPGGFEYVGKVRELVPGEVLALERSFREGGTYDGLGLPKMEGDFGTVELYEGRWWGRRAYFRADGTPIGEIYNIHTPPELYPDHVRYLDLEVDLVRTPDGEVRVIDEEVLERKVKEGHLGPALAKRALKEALWLKEELSGR